MKIGRTVPPAAAPISAKAISTGLLGLFMGESEKNRFSSELKRQFGMDHCFLVSSGKAALTLIFEALKALDPSRSEVLIPAFCCYSIPSAIVRAGLKVKLCDICPETLDFDYQQLTDVLKETKPLCIVSVHQFGLPADVQRLREVSAGSGAVIVEDAAQGMGGGLSPHKLGRLGDISLFSLGRGKAFSTVEGGIILTNCAEIARQIDKSFNDLPTYRAIEVVTLIAYAVVLAFFLRPVLFWLPSAMPFLKLGETIYDPDFKLKKISAFQAGLARGWLERLRGFSSKRNENAEYFLSRPLGLKTSYFRFQEKSMAGLIRLPLKFDNPRLKAEALQRSASLGLGIATVYPDSIDGIPELKNVLNVGGYPAAKSIVSRLVTLPVHPYLTEGDKMNIQNLLSTI